MQKNVVFQDVLNANETQEFEREFFAFRSVTRVSFFVCAVLFGDVYFIS